MRVSKVKKIVRGRFLPAAYRAKEVVFEKLHPLDITPVLTYDNLNTRGEINEWIKNGIKCFREWYQPVDFGDGIVAHVTRPPFWGPAPEFDQERGVGKWNYIIKRNLPDLRGKRVLDLGCNNGIISLELAKAGAREVIGIDRNEFIHQRTYDELPAQNIIAQANFVKKAFELKGKKSFAVKYMAADVADVGELGLGKFDMVLALCVLYHEMEGMPRVLAELAGMTDHLVIQTSLTHGGELAKWADLYNQVKLVHQAGFCKITIDAPVGYHLPMIIGMK